MTTSSRSAPIWSSASPTACCGGTDWPHPNMKSHMPDDGVLVSSLAKIAPTAALQKSLLVDNPIEALLGALT